MEPRIAGSTADAGLRLAIVGAGPVGLALALQAAQRLPTARVQLFDARPLDRDVSADARTLALSLGSVQLLQRLGAWEPRAAQPISEVHVSQQAPSLPTAIARLVGEPVVRIRAIDEAVPLLGAVLAYGAIVAPLQRAWLAACAHEPRRLASRFGTPVRSLKPLHRDGAARRIGAVEVDAGIAEPFDLAVVAEGGVFTAGRGARAAPGRRGAAGAEDAADAAGRAAGGGGVAAGNVGRLPGERPPLRLDYGQTAWVGSVSLRGGRRGVAYERFTRHGPAALLPLPRLLRQTATASDADSGRAALVWCVDSHDDPVRGLTDAQRLAVLATLFPAEAGALVAVSPLTDFALGLSAEPTLVHGRTVRMGNAAQTLHPVAGQGLNLGLRDAVELVRGLAASADGDVDAVLRRLEWQRAPDRWALIAATDFLARSFTWQLPGAAAARGLGLAALQAFAPLKSALTRQMMFGRR